MMFQLTSVAINPNIYTQQLRNPSAGAFASFEGWVRNHHQGKTVIALEYEAMASLCQSEAEKILSEARQRFALTEAICIHRTGHLSVGDLAVWVGVSASHRDEAFKACRYIIDEVKDRLPIWKKEFFADGLTEWVNCKTNESKESLQDVSLQSGGTKGVLFPHAAVGEYGKSPQCQDPVTHLHQYYSRQMILPDIGVVGQTKLNQARVLVVGAGGLGCPALVSLAQVGVGTLGICEFDTVDLSNLHRQSLYTINEVGKLKIQILTNRLQALNPYITIKPHPFRLNIHNYLDMIKDYDYILDCTDNFETKFLLNDIAVLHHKTLIQASVYQYEGQIRTYRPGASTPCLRCLWPEIPKSNCIGNCVQAGVFGAVTNVFGHLQALETIKVILDWPDQLGKEMLIFDLKSLQTAKIRQSQNTLCPVCGVNAVIQKIMLESYMTKKPEPEPELTISLETFLPSQFKEYEFIDVREEMELRVNPVTSIKSINLPFSEYGTWSFEFEKDKKYLLFCAHGMRSLACVERLHHKGITNVQSINDGAEAVQYFASQAMKNAT